MTYIIYKKIHEYMFAWIVNIPTAETESFNSFEWIPEETLCHTKETEEKGKDKYLTFYTQAYALRQPSET